MQTQSVKPQPSGWASRRKVFSVVTKNKEVRFLTEPAFFAFASTVKPPKNKKISVK